MARASYSSRPAGRAVSSRGVAQANGQMVRGRGRGGRPGRPLPACDCCYCVDQRRTAARLSHRMCNGCQVCGCVVVCVCRCGKEE